MLDITTLKPLRHYEMFFFGEGQFKGEDRMGDFAQAMYKTGKNYLHAYSRADLDNMHAMRNAIGMGGLHELLTLCWTDLPSTHGHCVTALVLLGYPPRMLYQMLKGDDITGNGR